MTTDTLEYIYELLIFNHSHSDMLPIYNGSELLIFNQIDGWKIKTWGLFLNLNYYEKMIVSYS